MLGNFVFLNRDYTIAGDMIACVHLNHPRDDQQQQQTRATGAGVRVWLRPSGVNLAPQIGATNGQQIPAYLDFWGADAQRLRRLFSAPDLGAREDVAETAAAPPARAKAAGASR